MMRIIGLTGGIGSGKSTVSEYLKRKGCVIVDADELSRKMTEKGSPALDKLRKGFGDEFFLEDGALDRRRMAALVFSDTQKKQLLESIITKAVVDESVERLNALRSSREKGIAVLDAPLLFEFNMQAYTDEVWVVRADEETVTARVKARDGMSREELLRRISNQLPSAERERLADKIIDNSSDLEHLYAQLDRLLSEQYEQL